jgi:hypothetical protein
MPDNENGIDFLPKPVGEHVTQKIPAFTHLPETIPPEHKLPEGVSLIGISLPTDLIA